MIQLIPCLMNLVICIRLYQKMPQISSDTKIITTYIIMTLCVFSALTIIFINSGSKYSSCEQKYLHKKYLVCIATVNVVFDSVVCVIYALIVARKLNFTTNIFIGTTTFLQISFGIFWAIFGMLIFVSNQCLMYGLIYAGNAIIIWLMSAICFYMFHTSNYEVLDSARGEQYFRFPRYVTSPLGSVIVDSENATKNYQTINN